LPNLMGVRGLLEAQISEAVTHKDINIQPILKWPEDQNW